jgi:hypothetical protein
MRGWKLSENYALDVSVLDRVRAFSDGVDFVELSSSLHLYPEDHHPRLEFRLGLFNVCLLGIEVYNVHHLDEEEVA